MERIETARFDQGQAKMGAASCESVVCMAGARFAPSQTPGMQRRKKRAVPVATFVAIPLVAPVMCSNQWSLGAQQGNGGGGSRVSSSWMPGPTHLKIWLYSILFDAIGAKPDTIETVRIIKTSPSSQILPFYGTNVIIILRKIKPDPENSLST